MMYKLHGVTEEKIAVVEVTKLREANLLPSPNLLSPGQPTPCLSTNCRRATLSGCACGWWSARGTNAPSTWAQRAANRAATSSPGAKARWLRPGRVDTEKLVVVEYQLGVDLERQNERLARFQRQW